LYIVPARPPVDGVTAGLSVAFLHAASALIAIYGLYYLLERAVMTAFSSVSAILELASYAAIAAIGSVLLVFSIRERLWSRKQPGADPPTAEGGAGKKSLAAIIAGS
jgi:ABC-type nickel/cobalt efflux system permease component RcnA